MAKGRPCGKPTLGFPTFPWTPTDPLPSQKILHDLTHMKPRGLQWKITTAKKREKTHPRKEEKQPFPRDVSDPKIGVRRWLHYAAYGWLH